MSDASIEIPNTVEGYAELERFLDSVKEKSLSRWMEYYRLYAEADFYFFFRRVSSFGSTVHTTYGVPIFDHQVAIDRAKATQYHISKSRGIDLSGRRSGKSEQRTTVAPIWFYLRHPNMAATVVSVEKALAIRHLRRIKQELEKNKMYSTLWPDLFWDDPMRMNKEEGVVWSINEGLCLKGRTDIRSNQTIEAHAFYGGGPVGSGFDLALVDDAERRDKVSSPEAIEDLDRAFSEMMSLMTPRVVAKPVVLISNTKFAQAGLIQRIRDRYYAADPKLVFEIPAEIIEDAHAEVARKYVHTPELGPLGGEITWPYTRDFLVTKFEEMADKSEYTLQYAGSYRSDKLKALDEGRINWFLTAPQEQAAACTAYVCVDPSRGSVDPSAFIVWLLRRDKSKILADAVVKKLDPAKPEFMDELFRLVMLWNQLSERVVEVRVEDVGPSTWSELIEAGLRSRGCYIPVVKVRVGVRDAEQKFKSRKADRTYARWAPMLNRGEVWIPKPHSMGGRGIPCDIKGKGTYECAIDYFLNVEFRSFPNSVHDDMLDAGGMIEDTKTNAARPLVYGSARDAIDEDEEYYNRGVSWMSS